MSKTERNKKILFCSSFTPPVNAGGGRNAYNFGKFLVRKGCAVTLLSLNRKGKLKFKEKDEGLIIRRLLYFNHNILTKLFSLLIILPGYLYYVAKNDLIFIYGGNIIAFEMIILFGHLFGKKIIFRSTMFEEDDLETLTKKRIGGKIRKKIMGKISLYFSINPAFTQSWTNIYHKKNKVFESLHGVDTSIFYPIKPEGKKELRKKLHLPINTFIIISVGYLIERKGFREIFQGLSKLEFPFLYLLIGDYNVPKNHYLINYNKEMKILYNLGKTLFGNKIIFFGSKSNINEYLKASDVFILNSKQEGFPPNSVLESMACEIPTIVRKIDGTTDSFFENNKNIILTSGEISEIKQHITKLYFEPQLRKSIGSSATNTINKHASFDVVWERLKKKLKMPD